ncbi:MULTISPECIES: sce7726 family protein [Streptomyces]|uniref:Sce7726 family protein n=1 Tax=Streptomyces auratus AGR0001 TaxID=1160718 RepID=A0A8B1NQH9_9ACTN|nr:sce7726 family protein [Streptomyces auratus]QTZ95765.1 sce7726 family protein [Streptomyces auratus AGR0001]
MNVPVQDLRDADLRPVLRSWVRKRPGWGQAAMREELGLCNGEARADLAVLAPRLAGFEIKSSGDRLDRLTRQVRYYDQIFDESWLVTTDRHLHHAESLTSSWWGLLQVETGLSGPTLSTVRPATTNPALDPLALARLLWRDETLAALRTLGRHKGISRYPRHRLWQLLADGLPPQDLSQVVRRCLAARPQTVTGADQ